MPYDETLADNDTRIATLEGETLEIDSAGNTELLLRMEYRRCQPIAVARQASFDRSMARRTSGECLVAEREYRRLNSALRHLRNAKTAVLDHLMSEEEILRAAERRRYEEETRAYRLRSRPLRDATITGPRGWMGDTGATISYGSPPPLPVADAITVGGSRMTLDVARQLAAADDIEHNSPQDHNWRTWVGEVIPSYSGLIEDNPTYPHFGSDVVTSAGAWSLYTRDWQRMIREVVAEIDSRPAPSQVEEDTVRLAGANIPISHARSLVSMIPEVEANRHVPDLASVCYDADIYEAAAEWRGNVEWPVFSGDTLRFLNHLRGALNEYDEIHATPEITIMGITGSVDRDEESIQMARRGL
jgi:hypothetical protein